MTDIDTAPELGGEELALEIPGLRLAARAWGPADGTKVLAFHGWLDNAGSFARLAPLLPQLRLVAIDLPGHGRSEWRHASASYDFVQWLPDALAAADALGWQRCSLLGHSLGAAVAICAAAVATERVDRVALIDGLGPLSCPAEEAPQRLARAIASNQRQRRLRPVVYASRDQMAERLLDAIAGLDDTSARVLLARGVRTAVGPDVAGSRLEGPARPGGLTWSHDPRLRGASLLRLTEEQVIAFLRRVEAEVLVLRAREGWPVEESAVRARLDCLQRAELEIVPGCHHLHLVTPERVAERLARWFDPASDRAS